jgi:Ca2+/Na+ antiporter
MYIGTREYILLCMCVFVCVLFYIRVSCLRFVVYVCVLFACIVLCFTLGQELRENGRELHKNGRVTG